MDTGTTQPRGTGRGGHSEGQTAGAIGELRATTTRPAGWKARLITTIGAIRFNLSARLDRFGGVVAGRAAAAAVLTALVVVLAPAPAQAQNKPTLQLGYIAGITSVSTEDGSPTFRYKIRSEGTVNQNRRFCGNGYAAQHVVAGANSPWVSHRLWR